MGGLGERKWEEENLPLYCNIKGEEINKTTYPCQGVKLMHSLLMLKELDD